MSINVVDFGIQNERHYIWYYECVIDRNRKEWVPMPPPLPPPHAPQRRTNHTCAAVFAVFVIYWIYQCLQVICMFKVCFYNLRSYSLLVHDGKAYSSSATFPNKQYTIYNIRYYYKTCVYFANLVLIRIYNCLFILAINIITSVY